MNICVLGLWHLGTVTAAALSSVGHNVVGLDFDLQSTVEGLETGSSPIYEPGLDDLIKEGLANNRLRFSYSIVEACVESDVLWVAYDTPVDEEDCADVDYVIERVRKVLPSLPSGAIVLVSSQIPVGSIRRLEAIAAKECPFNGLSFAYSPENLRLGKALEVFLNPDRIVVGIRSERDRVRLQHMLMPITPRIEWMTVESAEMTKHAINAFLATSVTFANEISTICELVGADAKEVERGLKTEQRIGAKAYLSPGSAFAGGTLARDIGFLRQIGKSKGLVTHLISSVKKSNDEHKRWAQRKLLETFPDLRGRRIAVWGLTYKPGTNTLRRSLSVELCDWILKRGAQLKVHDPEVDALPKNWGMQVTLCKTPMEALIGSDALIVSTEWPQYKDVTHDEFKFLKAGFLILDANRFLKNISSSNDLTYIAVGMPKGEGL